VTPQRKRISEIAILENGWGQRKRWTTGRPAFVCELIRHAAADHLTTPAMLLSKSRQRNVVEARWQVIRGIAADQRKFSLSEIGRWLGGMHHTTVLHCLQLQDTRPYASTAPVPAPFNPDSTDVAAGDEWNI
jgi:hypothetical protein